ncbi:MAG: hypothetical protein RLZZ308_659 [Candidatus Parcubacteria bacterium]|jgi:hypothetical protein
MSIFSLFFKFEIATLGNYLKTRTSAKMITLLLFLLVFLFVGVGIYFFFLSGLRYIEASVTDDIRHSVNLFIYELFLLILSGVIFLSSLISGVLHLFKGKNDTWILASPTYSLLPKIVFVRTILRSAIPSIIVFLPALLAFNKVYTVSHYSILFIGCSLLFFLLTICSITLSLLLLTIFGYYKLVQKLRPSLFSFKNSIIVLFIATLGLVYAVWNNNKSLDFVALFKAEETVETIQMSTIATHFQLLPTHPFAMQLIYWQNKEIAPASLYFLLMAVITIISVLFWWKISPVFYPMWQKFQEGGTNSTWFLSKKMKYTFTGNLSQVLFKKEMLLFTRNSRGILWSCFFFSIWLLQIGTNNILNKNISRHQLDITEKFAILQSLQYIIALYFISSFALRFVFPSFSIEKKTSWILLSAPINFRKIFFGKYIFFITLFTTLGLVMSYITMTVLGLSIANTLYSTLLLTSVSIAIITFALILGAFFPNTETDDPEIIATSMTGLFFTAISLTYGGISGWVLYTTLIKNSQTLLVSFVIFTLGLTISMLYITPKYIKILYSK